MRVCKVANAFKSPDGSELAMLLCCLALIVLVPSREWQSRQLRSTWHHALPAPSVPVVGSGPLPALSPPTPCARCALQKAFVATLQPSRPNALAAQLYQPTGGCVLPGMHMSRWLLWGGAKRHGWALRGLPDRPGLQGGGGCGV